MTTSFLHGVETIEVNDGIRPVVINAQGVIGVIGTAPLADPIAFPLDEPVLLLSQPRLAATLGTTGTLLNGIKQAYVEGGTAIVVVRVATDPDPGKQMGKIIGDPILRTGLHAFLNARPLLAVTPKILMAPGFTSLRPTTGVSAIAVTNGGTGYLPGQFAVRISDSAGGTGTGAAATAALDQNGVITAIVVTLPGVGYTSPVAQVVPANGAPGAGAVLSCTAAQARNPVVAALLSIAPALRAIVYADTPSTSLVDAVTWRQDWGDQRLVPFYSDALIFDNDLGAYVDLSQSASQAGLTASVIANSGYWFSSSNFELKGVGGVAVPVDVAPSDPNSTANYLNGLAINTIVNFGGNYGGYRRWGNRTTSDDPLWVFEAVRRTQDVVNDMLENAFLWMVDKPFGVQLLVDASTMATRALRFMKSQGALVGGSVWLDPERNTESQLQQGIVAWDLDDEPVAPMEHVQLYVHRNGNYYTEALQTAAAQVASATV